MATRSMREPAESKRPGLTPVSLLLVLMLFWIVTQVELVLVLGLLALLFGTILEGPVQFFQKRHFPRPAAILMVYLIIIGGLVLLVVAIAPNIADQASGFSTDVPEQLRELRDDWQESDNGLLNGPGVGVLDRAIETIDGDSEVSVSSDAVQQAIPLLTNITGGLVSTVTLLVMTFYYLLEKRLLRGLILETLTPRLRDRVDSLWSEVESKVGGWMRGQLVLCLIIGTIATVSYGIIGLSFWPLLGLWAGITEIVPIIGPWIGGVPAVLVALTESWELAIITTAIILTMQGLENWVLVPRVMKGAVGLTPLTVFIAILAGTQFMGVVGAVLAIPIAATIQVILTDFLERRDTRDERQTARSGWRWMLSRSGLRDAEDSEIDSGEHPHRDHDDDDDSSYIAQHESDSYFMNRESASEDADTPTPEPESTPHEPAPAQEETEPDDGDTTAEPLDLSTWPADATGEDGTAAGPDQPAPDTSVDDGEDSPAFQAWPRPSDKDGKRPPGSTWPPLEEGRPKRRRKRPDTDE